jgi:uncharacterized damage-inducible protein DinB
MAKTVPIMVDTLQPIWKQFTETYEALRQALAEVPDDRLEWRPGPRANTVAVIVQHIARANGRYANMMERGEPGELRSHEESPGRDRLLERLADSESRVRETFERMTLERLAQVCADQWSPLGPKVEGPLDALWFAQQIVRHSAYHLGQINVYLLLLEGEDRP